MKGNISDYHGEVSICGCGIYKNPNKPREKACKFCFDRGFVAKCLGCDGKGQIEEKMAGGPGKMMSTCLACGGIGSFGVNKPQYWEDEPKEVEKDAETEEPEGDAEPAEAATA